MSNKAGKKKISIKFKKVTGAKAYGSYSAKVKKLNKNSTGDLKKFPVEFFV